MQPIPAAVAPMEGITTFPTRLWLHLASQPVAATTPFLRATKVFPERALPATFVPELFSLRGVLPYDVTPQFMACEVDHFVRAVELLPDAGDSVAELNCGCPSPNGAGKNAGAGILRDPHAFGMTIDQLCRKLGPKRLAVKMRLGIDAPEEFHTLLPHLVALPLARLTVHGRTRADKYRGVARWDKIQYAAATTETPTWASGDVVNIATLNALQQTAPSIRGVMIGRGILYNPWIFEELRSGAPIVLNHLVLAHALTAYALLHELWMRDSEKLISRILSTKIGAHCGLNVNAWSQLCVVLSSALGLAPVILFHADHVPDIFVSPHSFRRMKVLWTHLVRGLPSSYQSPRMNRAKDLRAFLQEFLRVSSENDFHLSASPLNYSEIGATSADQSRII